LGFADRTLGLRLPEKTRKAGNEIRSRLQKLGLLRESGHEHFNGSLVIPVIGIGGDITEVARSPTGCALARRITCICRVRIAACGMRRCSPPTRKSSSASP
jgi:hypothetical protein